MPSAQPSGKRVGLVTAHRDRRVWQQARSLLAAGWQAEVFPAREAAAVGIPPELPSFTALEEATASAAGRKMRGSLYAATTRLGIRWVAPLYQLLRARFRPLADSVLARNRERLVSANYDLLIAHDLPTLPLCVAAAGTKARVVYDSHELYPEQAGLPRHARDYWSRVEAAHIGSAALVVTVNQGVAEELQQRYQLACRPFLLPNVCHYRARAERTGSLAKLYKLPAGRPVVLCQGGLMPGRGLEMVVEAWPLLPSPRPRLAFLGEGPMLGWIRRRVERLALSGTVFAGASVPEEKLLDCTADADLGLIPYAQLGDTPRNTMLSSPNRLFEYLMARLPILAWDLPEVRRVLSESRTGLCATWDTRSELAAAIQRALAWRKEVSAEMLEGAAQRFSFEHYEPQWLAALTAALPSDS